MFREPTLVFSMRRVAKFMRTEKELASDMHLVKKITTLKYVYGLFLFIFLILIIYVVIYGTYIKST